MKRGAGKGKRRIPYCILGVCILSLFAALFLGTAGCGASRGGSAVILEDPYWAPILAETDMEAVLRRVRGNTKTKVFRLILAAGESPAELLESYIEREKPSSVVMGSFIALELQSLAERYGDVRFICLDAPRTPPPATPYIWVRFDPGPALRLAGETVRRHLETRPPLSEGGSSVPAVFLSAGYEDSYSENFLPSARGGLPEEEALPEYDTAVFSSRETVESVRPKALEKIRKKPPLYIVFAGTHNPLILSLIREGTPASILLDLRGGIPEMPGFPFLASVEKDYEAALSAVLSGEGLRGEVFDVPMRLREH